MGDIGGQESPVKTAIGVSTEKEMPAAMDYEKQVALATKAYEDLIAALGPRECSTSELPTACRDAYEDLCPCVNSLHLGFFRVACCIWVCVFFGNSFGSWIGN